MRLLLLISLLFVLHQPGVAHDLVYGIETFQVELELREDGTYHVEEAITFRVDAGTFSQGYRSLVTRRIDDIQNVEVRSPDTEIIDVQHHIRSGGHSFTWNFPERGEDATFVISYDVVGALRAEDGQNLIDWDAVGDAWEVPIEQLEVGVVWPDFGLARDSIRYEPIAEGTLQRTGDGWAAYFTSEQLEAGTPYRVVLTFPQQLEDRTANDIAGDHVVAFLMALLLGFLPGLVARVRWRDRGPDRSPIPCERPNIELPEAAFLLTDYFSFTQRVYPALLFDLARGGHLTLRQTKEKSWWGETEKLEVDCHPDPTALATFEEAFLKELSSHEHFGDFLSKSSSFQRDAVLQIREQLVDKGVLEDVSARSNRLILSAFVFAVAGGTLATVFSGLVVAVMLGLTAGVVMGIFFAATKRYRLTEAGAPLKARAEAYLAEIRTSIEDTLGKNPAEAVRQLLDHLPWLLLDPAVTQPWFARFEKTIEDAGGELQLPSWIDQPVITDDEMHILAFLTIVNLTRPSYSSSSTSMGTSGITAGTGMSGGIGGGGCGIR